MTQSRPSRVLLNSRALQLASGLAGDGAFMLDMVKLNGQTLEQADGHLKGDRNVVLTAVAADGDSLEFASENLKADRDLILNAVKQDGLLLRHASPALSADLEVVLRAVGQNGLALKYACSRFQDDREVVLHAVQKSGDALQYASSSLRDDWGVVRQAVRQDGMALRHSSERLHDDLEIVMTAVGQDGWALEYASADLQTDPDVLALASKHRGGSRPAELEGLRKRTASKDRERRKSVRISLRPEDQPARQELCKRLRSKHQALLALRAAQGKPGAQQSKAVSVPNLRIPQSTFKAPGVQPAPPPLPGALPEMPVPPLPAALPQVTAGSQQQHRRGNRTTSSPALAQAFSQQQSVRPSTAVARFPSNPRPVPPVPAVLPMADSPSTVRSATSEWTAGPPRGVVATPPPGPTAKAPHWPEVPELPFGQARQAPEPPAPPAALPQALEPRAPAFAELAAGRAEAEEPEAAGAAPPPPAAAPERPAPPALPPDLAAAAQALLAEPVAELGSAASEAGTDTPERKRPDPLEPPVVAAELEILAAAEPRSPSPPSSPTPAAPVEAPAPAREASPPLQPAEPSGRGDSPQAAAARGGTHSAPGFLQRMMGTIRAAGSGRSPGRKEQKASPATPGSSRSPTSARRNGQEAESVQAPPPSTPVAARAPPDAAPAPALASPREPSSPAAVPATPPAVASPEPVASPVAAAAPAPEGLAATPTVAPAAAPVAAAQPTTPVARAPPAPEVAAEQVPAIPPAAAPAAAPPAAAQPTTPLAEAPRAPEVPAAPSSAAPPAVAAAAAPLAPEMPEQSAEGSAAEKQTREPEGSWEAEEQVKAPPPSTEPPAPAPARPQPPAMAPLGLEPPAPQEPAPLLLAPTPEAPPAAPPAPEGVAPLLPATAVLTPSVAASPAEALDVTFEAPTPAAAAAAALGDAKGGSTGVGARASAEAEARAAEETLTPAAVASALRDVEDSGAGVGPELPAGASTCSEDEASPRVDVAPAVAIDTAIDALATTLERDMAGEEEVVADAALAEPAVDQGPAVPRRSSVRTAEGVAAEWSGHERSLYAAALSLAGFQGEEVVQQILEDAMVVAPLPAPWTMQRDGRGKPCFVNSASGEVTAAHPLEQAFRELAGACRACLALPPGLRDSCVTTLLEKWDAEAKSEFDKWQRVPSPYAGDQDYFRHVETGEVSQHGPMEVVLPALYVKHTSLARLRDSGSMSEIYERRSTLRDQWYGEAGLIGTKSMGDGAGPREGDATLRRQASSQGAAASATCSTATGATTRPGSASPTRSRLGALVGSARALLQFRRSSSASGARGTSDGAAAESQGVKRAASVGELLKWRRRQPPAVAEPAASKAGEQLLPLPQVRPASAQPSSPARPEGGQLAPLAPRPASASAQLRQMQRPPSPASLQARTLQRPPSPASLQARTLQRPPSPAFSLRTPEASAVSTARPGWMSQADSEAAQVGRTGDLLSEKMYLQVWRQPERRAYVAALGILRLPEEDAFARVLEDAIASPPLPPPWEMRRDVDGQVFYMNWVSGSVSWSHPLEPHLRELAGACRECLALPPGQDEARANEFVDRWQTEAEQDMTAWQRMTAGGGRLCFQNAFTGEESQEYPAKVILPGHWLKLRAFMELLRGDAEGFKKLRAMDATCKQLDATPPEGQGSATAGTTATASEAAAEAAPAAAESAASVATGEGSAEEEVEV